MPSPTRRQKLFVLSILVTLLLVIPNSCYATTTHTYMLLDSPDGSTRYRLTVSVTDTLYDYYVSQDNNLYNYDFSKFVTPNALQPIADDLWSIYNNSEDFANGVLMITHQIPYVESTPQKYAIETLVENEGDCDLFSILAASIMKAGGLDVVLLLLEEQEHMMVGVHLPISPTDARSAVCYYTHENKRYYVAETTGGNWANGWRVGECSEELQSATAQIVPLTNSEVNSPGQVSSSYSMPDSAALQMTLSTDLTLSNNVIQISGALSPTLAGENITLYVSSMGSPLTALATVVTDSNGQYSHTWQSPAWGIYTVRANWSGDDEYSGADSSTSKLIVLPFELLLAGVVLIAFSVVMLVIFLGTRKNKLETQGTFDDWCFDDCSEDF